MRLHGSLPGLLAFILLVLGGSHKAEDYAAKGELITATMIDERFCLPNQHHWKSDEADCRMGCGLRIDAKKSDVRDKKANNAVDRVPDENTEAHSDAIDDRNRHHVG